jgi:hypothetical protein
MIQTAQPFSEVQVLLTEEIPIGQEKEVWRAVVLQMPHLVVEGQGREEVIASIRKLIGESVRRAEIITMPLSDLNDSVDLPVAAGYRHYGVFENDPEAMKLFDEIEEERNKHFVEPLQP